MFLIIRKIYLFLFRTHVNYHELGNITSITAGGDKPSIYSKELTEKYYTPIYSNG